MATKSKSLFADEKRFKEELGELYLSVAGNEQAPGNLQMERLDLANKQLKSYQAEWAKLQGKYSQLLSAGL